MSSVLAVAFPVFAIIAAGLAAGRLGWMSAADSGVLNKFVFRFAMPAALFGLTAGATPPGENDLIIGLSYGAGAIAVLFSSYFLSQAFFPLSKQEAGAHALASVFGNAVFLGLPIALSIEGWARPFVSLMLIEGTIIFALGSALIAPRRDGGAFIARAAGLLAGPLKNPIIIGMIAGFFYSALGLSFSGPAKTFFDLLGRAAGPAALFSLGVFLATHKFPAFKSVAGRTGMIAFFKLAVLPAIALGISTLLGLDDPAYRGALALFLFVPSAVAAFIMASQYKVYTSETAAAVSFTTILSVLTISAVLAVFG